MVNNYQIQVNRLCWGGGGVGGDFHIKGAGMLVRNFELNP